MQDFSDERIKRILALSPAVIYTCRASGDFGATFVSDNVTTILGYSPRECLETPDFWRENIHPDDRERVLADYPSFYGIEHYVHEYRFRKKDGGYLWILDELRLIHDSEGNPVEIVGSWLDISGRKATESALKKSEALFRIFFESNPVATIITSPSGVVHQVNPAFIKNTDYSLQEVVGKTSQELGFWNDPDARDCLIREVQEHGFINDMESCFYGKNRQPMTCLVSSRAIEYDGEVRVLSTVRDITEQKKAEEVLLKLDQAKSDFISIVAHELRTPLIAIVGYSELLEYAANSGLTEEQKENYLSIIQSNAESLNLLVDDLLDVGRIQVGKPLGVSLKENDLAVPIKKASDSLRMKSGQHKIVIAHENPMPESLWFDEGRICQVLNNLLSNAIKYSPQGGVININTMTDQDKVTVSIVDYGLGMSPQQVAHIFDRFYRGGFEPSDTSGLGLGMNIVKQVIDDHGGGIVVSSLLGEGTTVSFTLPRNR